MFCIFSVNYVYYVRVSSAPEKIGRKVTKKNRHLQTFCRKNEKYLKFVGDLAIFKHVYIPIMDRQWIGNGSAMDRLQLARSRMCVRVRLITRAELIKNHKKFGKLFKHLHI